MRMLKELLEHKLKDKFVDLQKDIERAQSGEANDQQE